MPKKPKVSIIIATHNHAHFLPECLESVKNQTYTDYEVIIVNNGSTDATDEVVRRLRWDQVRYFFQQDTGSVAGPRNTGISHANGDHVAFLDSDDLWYKTKLERSMDIIEKDSAIDVFSHDLYLTRQGKTKRLLRCGPLHEDMFKAILIQNRLNSSATIVKTSVLREVGGFSEKKEFIHAEDSELWLRIALAKKKFAFLNEALGEYRVHQANLSNDFETVLNNERNVIREHFKKLQSPVPLHGHFLYHNRLCRIYFKKSVQYFFRKQYGQTFKNALLSLLPNPFYLPFNFVQFFQSIK